MADNHREDETPEEKFRRLINQTDEPINREDEYFLRDFINGLSKTDEQVTDIDDKSPQGMDGVERVIVDDGENEFETKPLNLAVRKLAADTGWSNDVGSDTQANVKTQPQDVSDLEKTPPPPELGETPRSGMPVVDEDGFPIRKQKRNQDWAAEIPPSIESHQAVDKKESRLKRQKEGNGPKIKISDQLGCIFRMGIIGLFIIVTITLCIGSVGIFQYYNIAKDLPSVEDLREKASIFETTRILDRNGNVLYEILDPNAGRRTYVKLEDMSPYLIAATIATEDKDFYSNPGFDIFGIARALIQNFKSQETVSGASTITQQLTRNLILDTEERIQRTYTRKIREAILAQEITRRYTKDEILELYLNEINYGNLAYGIEAAAKTYFGIPAKNLNLGQAAFLAGLPQLPSIYNVYTNKDITLKRQQDVLLLMYQTSLEQNCIYVSNNQQGICVGAGEAALAAQEINEYEFHSPDIQIRYPHWVNYVRSQLEEQFDAQTIYRSGFTVYTTLDPGLQDTAQSIVREQIGKLEKNHATNGALIALRPGTGEILAMVGSADFYDEAIDGQVNMSIRPRQPGSSIKPLTYVAAFEKGWTASTLIWDVPSEFPPSGDPNDPRPPYKPVNYDGTFHGPVTVRSALANSYNIPAVKALDFIGIYDDPQTNYDDGLVGISRRLGIESLTRDDYGLSLTLGGGEVTLLEMTTAFGVFANGGRSIKPVAIEKIVDHNGELVYQYEAEPGDQIIRSEHAFLISSILSDNNARTPAFGQNSVLNLPFLAASKTGTTNDYRDNWTIGYTPDIAVGTWVGNADYTPMQNTSGLTGAAPIWSKFITESIQSITGGNPSGFAKPPGIVERVICVDSGTEPSQWCPKQRSEYFASDQLPLLKGYDLWQKALIDTWTGLLESADCSEFSDEILGLNVVDPWAIKWIEETKPGENWAKDAGFEKPIFFTPDKACSSDDPRPTLEFQNPQANSTIIESPLTIFGQVNATKNFYQYRLEYGIGDDPVQWEILHQKKVPMVEPDEIFSWDLLEIPEGIITLRLYMISTEDTYAEQKIQIILNVPTPTPTPTGTPTASPTYTKTPTPTMTPTIIPTSTTMVTPTPIIISPIRTPKP